MESNIEVLPKLKIKPLNDSAIRLWGIHPKEIKTRSQRDICTLMFIAVLFTMPLLFSRSVMSDCDPMDCSTPGFPVHHQLPELAQTQNH